MCCLFGLIDHQRSLPMKQKNRLISALATAAEVRGTDATGIAYNQDGAIHIYKQPVAGHEMHFKLPGNVSTIMGHTRMTTQGNPRKNRNNHPFPGHVGATDFALAHNGMICNDNVLRRTLHLPKSRIETDSYVSVQLLEQKTTLDFASLQYMAEQLQGSFTISVLNGQDDLYLVKGDNPLCLYYYPRVGLYIYASTEQILKSALSRLNLRAGNYEKIPMSEGDILRVDRNGGREWGTFDALRSYYDGRSSFRLASYPTWWNAVCETGDETYLDELKTVASAFGYTPESIDSLYAQGFAPEEIEEFLYESEGYINEGFGN